MQFNYSPSEWKAEEAKGWNQKSKAGRPALSEMIRKQLNGF